PRPGWLDVDLGLAKHGEELALPGIFKQALHAGIDVGSNVRGMDSQLRVRGLLDRRRCLRVEAEAGDHQFVVSLACADQFLNLLRGYRPVLWPKPDRHRVRS